MVFHVQYLYLYLYAGAGAINRIKEVRYQIGARGCDLLLAVGRLWLDLETTRPGMRLNSAAGWDVRVAAS
jgi:hypothetical protein